ncbi:MAG TPA: 50S ribosomal protein L19 [Gemmataceae bacterium]|nr:50S ribosomal protein L19 [Gemmataceae bacterium]
MAELNKKQSELIKQPSERTVPEIQVGDTVDVHFWIELGEKGRTQVFNGTVIAIKGEKPDEFVTVRRIVQGEGVERIFPLLSPRISKIEVKKTGHVRRAKLYYLRKRVGKATRLKERKKGEAETTSKAQKAEKAAAK